MTEVTRRSDFEEDPYQRRRSHAETDGMHCCSPVLGLLKLAEPLVIWAFRKENVRILAELKP